MPPVSNPPGAKPSLYEDFEISIEPRSADGKFPVRAEWRGPSRIARGRMVFPIDEPQWQNWLNIWQNAPSRSDQATRHLHSMGELPTNSGVQELGQNLFAALFGGEVRDLYRLLQDHVRQTDKRLRLKLCIHAPELAVLPWEFLYDDDYDHDYIALTHTATLVRTVDTTLPVQMLTSKSRLRILGMAAAPHNLPPLNIQKEKELVEDALHDLRTPVDAAVDLIWVKGQTWPDLERDLRANWHVFHFIGHSAFDKKHGSLALAGQAGQSALLSADALARELKRLNSVRLVVLNSCEGALGSNRDIFSSIATTLIRQGITAVLAMQSKITDRAAIEFSRALYTALARGESVATAVAEARRNLYRWNPHSTEWAVPVLYMRGEDGPILEPFQFVPERPLEGGNPSRSENPVGIEPDPKPLINSNPEPTSAVRPRPSLRTKFTLYLGLALAVLIIGSVIYPQNFGGWLFPTPDVRLSPTTQPLVQPTDASTTAPAVTGFSPTLCANVSETELAGVECNALVVLYISTNGPNWITKTNWLETNTPCSSPWYGVMCEDNKIIILNLSNNRLSGAIPPELGTLLSLTDLDLHENRLTGWIPPQLGNLTNLTSLDLSDNQLIGSIPPQLGQLKQLSDLDLSTNQLNDWIPPELGELNNLIGLRLANNQLIGAIPPQLGHLANLQYLDLASNQLDGAIPNELGDLINLTELNLPNNQLSGEILPSLANLSNLIELDLDNNHLRASNASLIDFLHKKAPGWLESQTPSPSLSIPPFSCYTVAESELARPECEALVALYNSTDGPNWITRTNWLEPDTSPCSWYGVTCEGGVINQLSLENNHLSGTIPLEIGNLLHLDLLSLAANQLTGAIPKALGNLPHLTKLYLYQNQLSGIIPAELSHLMQLRELRLDNNNLSGEIPRQIGDIPELVELNLSSNHLTGNIPVELRNLRNLTRLVLNQNQLNGPIPSELNDLEALKIIWLYSNRLTGTIPDIWGEFTQLECLRLNSNQLTGAIPSSFGQLTNLKGERECPFGGDGLDLSDNVLNATDPALLDFLSQEDPDWAQTQRYDLVGHWQFDECDGDAVNDASGLENHGKLEATVTFTTDGMSGCALQFSAEGGQVVFNHSPSLEPVTGTIEAWVKVDELLEPEVDLIYKTTDKAVRRNQSGSNGSIYALRIRRDGSVYGLIYNDDPQAASVWTYAESPSNQITPNSWHHVALRWDGKEVAVLVDGVLSRSITNPVPYDPVPRIGLSYHKGSVFCLGCPTNNNPPFVGQLDNLRFYARALNDEEIQRDYQLSTGSAATPTGPLTPILEPTLASTSIMPPTSTIGAVIPGAMSGATSLPTTATVTVKMIRVTLPLMMVMVNWRRWAVSR